MGMGLLAGRDGSSACRQGPHRHKLSFGICKLRGWEILPMVKADPIIIMINTHTLPFVSKLLTLRDRFYIFIIMKSIMKQLGSALFPI